MGRGKGRKCLDLRPGIQIAGQSLRRRDLGEDPGLNDSDIGAGSERRARILHESPRRRQSGLISSLPSLACLCRISTSGDVEGLAVRRNLHHHLRRNASCPVRRDTNAARVTWIWRRIRARAKLPETSAIAATASQPTRMLCPEVWDMDSANLLCQRAVNPAGSCSKRSSAYRVDRRSSFRPAPRCSAGTRESALPSRPAAPG